MPVLTGLGHEIDRSVADEVANISLKTPTACATELIERVEAYCRRTELWSDIATRSLAAGGHADARLAATAHRIAVRTRGALDLADRAAAAPRPPGAGRCPPGVGRAARAGRAPPVGSAPTPCALRTSTLVVDNVEQIAWARSGADPGPWLEHHPPVRRQPRRAARGRRTGRRSGDNGEWRRHSQPRDRADRRNDVSESATVPGRPVAITYAAALRARRDPLLGLRRDNVDVDHLAERVKRPPS